MSQIHMEAGWCPDSRKRTGRWGSITASQGSWVVSRLKEKDRKKGEHPSFTEKQGVVTITKSI